MQTYITLLRGINVSGHKKILMADLKILFEDLGFSNVRTYIQSGNIIFNADHNAQSVYAKMINDKIKSSYEFEVPTLVLLPENLRHVMANCPYKEEDLFKSYFTLLHTVPLSGKISKLLEYTFPNETYFVSDHCVYSYPENGAGRAKANNNFFEKKLDVTATTRNYKTLIKLLEMSS